MDDLLKFGEFCIRKSEIVAFDGHDSMYPQNTIVIYTKSREKPFYLYSTSFEDYQRAMNLLTSSFQ